MKPNSLQEQFAQREIAPSDNAWGRLSAQLDKQERKRSKRGWLWLGSVAAVAAVLVTIYSASQMSTLEPAEQTSVVVEESSTPDRISDEIKDKPVQIKVDAVVHLSEPKRPVTTTTSTDRSRAPQKNEDINTVSVSKTVGVAVLPSVATELIDLPLSTNLALATVASPDLTDKLIEDEASRLLRDALQDLENKEPVIGASYVLSAEQLLREAEWDVEYNSRNHLQDKLKESLNGAAKNALATIGINRK